MTEPQFSSDWVSWHEPHWKEWLAPYVGLPHVGALEVGSYEGRSACWFLDNVLTGEGSYITCVDAWWNQEHEARWRANTAGRSVYQRRGLSRYVLSQLAVERRRYSFIYVDGDHSAAETLADLCQAWALLSPGGVMIADDYGWESPNRPIPPKPAIDAFLACYADRIDRHEIETKQVAMWKP